MPDISEMAEIPVLLAGAPGRMCAEIAAAAGTGFRILEAAVASPARVGQRFACGPAALRGIAIADAPALAAAHPGLVALDFSTPATALANIEAFAAAGIPVVAGATGYDMAAARRAVESSRACAVIAPNMGAPIVAIQAALEWAAQEFPGALEGMELRIRESHQAAKRDTSGTAKAFAAMLERLGLRGGAIESIRDPQAQRALGVPEAHLGGHAWHEFSAAAPDGSMALALHTRVCGRRPYAEGALRAARFLAVRMAAGDRGRVFTMADVLRGA
jgi:4-hydroxy-tetrahydrodipicolinate reductase